MGLAGRSPPSSPPPSPVSSTPTAPSTSTPRRSGTSSPSPCRKQVSRKEKSIVVWGDLSRFEPRGGGGFDDKKRHPPEALRSAPSTRTTDFRRRGSSDFLAAGTSRFFQTDDAVRAILF